MSSQDFSLTKLPARSAKPRKAGFTMAMDKGLSTREAEDFVLTCGDYVDVVKLGWATGYVTPRKQLEAKLAVYREAGLPYYFGGTLLEAYYIRGQFDDYLRLIDTFKAPFVEVSDGSITLAEEKKLGLIRQLSKTHTVLSEVGSKDAKKVIPAYKWVEMMQSELDAGAWKVIAEARESGTVGVFRSTGEADSGLIEEILHRIPGDRILWEAPLKSQQVWFIKLLGSDVNLGNIAPNEIIPLETLRLGLRGDTFFTFLEQND